MDISKFIKDLENLPSASLTQSANRRAAIKKLVGGISASLLPLALSAQHSNSNARTTDTSVAGCLNFLLQLEYFEYNFFLTATSTGGLIPTGDEAGFVNIGLHELAHISVLSNAVTAAGGTPFLPKHYNNNPFCPAAYDFTAGGLYPIYTSGNYYMFLDFAQLFQDLFERAYIGVMPYLTGNKTALTTVMQLHTTEGRHASHVRLVRRYTNAPDYPKPWVTGTDGPYLSTPNQFEPFYAGEGNYWQNNIDLTTLQGVGGTISQTAATEAFDEAMDQPTTLGLISQFLLP